MGVVNIDKFISDWHQASWKQTKLSKCVVVDESNVNDEWITDCRLITTTKKYTRFSVYYNDIELACEMIGDCDLEQVLYNIVHNDNRDNPYEFYEKRKSK